jgi:hypothetical protein
VHVVEVEAVMEVDMVRSVGMLVRVEKVETRGMERMTVMKK